MSRLSRHQAALDVDNDKFIGDPVDYHYFINVFDEAVEKKVDDP